MYTNQGIISEVPSVQDMKGCTMLACGQTLHIFVQNHISYGLFSNTYLQECTATTP